MSVTTQNFGLNLPDDGEYGWHDLLRANLLTLDQLLGVFLNQNGTFKDITVAKMTITDFVANTIAANSGMTLGGVHRNTWPDAGNGSQALTDVLANGAAGNIPAGLAFDLRSSDGATIHLSVDEATGEVTISNLTAPGILADGELGNINNPLTYLPLKRAEEITGAAAAAGAQYSGAPTFTRSTTATYIDALDGLIKTAAINQPRFERMADGATGVLIEGASTNDQRYSEQLDMWAAPLNAVVTVNAVTAPDGTVTADLLTATAAGGRIPGVYMSARAGTYSVHAKHSVGSGLVRLEDFGSSGYWAEFDMINGVVSAKHAGLIESDVMITQLSDGWYRISVNLIHTVGSRFFSVKLQDSGDAAYIWGAQDEALPFPSSYIPTTTAAVTRAADALSIPLSGNVTMPDSVAGHDVTIIIDVAANGTEPASTKVRSILGTNTTQHTYLTRVYHTSVLAYNGSQPIAVAHGADITMVNRYALRKSAATGLYELYINGALVGGAIHNYPDAGNTSGSVWIGSRNAASEHFYGHLRNLRFFDRPLTDQEIAAA